MASRTWSRRAAIIAANNSLICAAMVLLGALGRAAWFGVVAVGLGLGIALRLMSDAWSSADEDTEDRLRVSQIRFRMALGVGLNLLEVPAIMLSAGLSLAQGAMSSTLDLPGALAAFSLVALPLLVVSAAGESLWLTACPGLPRP